MIFLWNTLVGSGCLEYLQEYIESLKKPAVVRCSGIGIGERDADVIRGVIAILDVFIPSLESLKNAALENMKSDKDGGDRPPGSWDEQAANKGVF
jgi:hypothetical protein